MKRTTLFGIALFAQLLGAIIAPTSGADTALMTGPGFQEPIPPAQLGRKLRSLTLSKTSVVGGSSLTGRVLLEFLAPSGGTRVALRLSTDSILPEDIEGGVKARLPVSVDVAQGKADATFSITTLPVLSERHITIEASAGGVTRTATFTIEPLLVASIVIVPPAGLGPFEAQGTIGLNAFPPSDANVSLSSSNPAVVRFGTFGSAQANHTLVFHPNESSKGFSLVASPVPQTTTVTITAALNGRSVTSTVTVRH